MKSKPTYEDLVRDTISIKGDTFAFFLRPPRGGKLRKLSQKDVDTFNEQRLKKQFAPLVAHAPYIYNLASVNSDIRRKTAINLQEDIDRLATLDNTYYNIHPGAHGGAGVEKGVKYIQEGINYALAGRKSVTILLETMAGKGSEIGGRFEDLARILDGIKTPEQVFVCFDTCHVFDAGYDILEHLEEVLQEFDRIIGLEKLKAIHLNDSKFGLASKKDRHAAIGFGRLGLKGVAALVRHPLLKTLPFILETPNDIFSHKEQLQLVQEIAVHSYSKSDLCAIEEELAKSYPRLWDSKE